MTKHQSEPNAQPASEPDYACKVCGNAPDETGTLEHGRGCYTQDEDGGGSEYIEEADKSRHPASDPSGREAVYAKHRKRCEREATRDVIFVFQRRRLRWTGRLPDGYEFRDRFVFLKGDGEEAEPQTLEAIYKAHGSEYAIETWDVESVWLDRDEAEAWAKAHEYNYRDGWRVYGMPADGELAKLLRGEHESQRHPAAPAGEREEVPSGGPHGMNHPKQPQWTVGYNIESGGRDIWIGTGWEFFDSEEAAAKCFANKSGAFKRRFHACDGYHLGAVHGWPNYHSESATIERQNARLAALEASHAALQARLLTAAGDDLCRLSQEEIKAMGVGAVPIPPKEEFLASCERFHSQVAGEAGVNQNCLTLAQLIAENAALQAKLDAVAGLVDESKKLQKHVAHCLKEFERWDFSRVTNGCGVNVHGVLNGMLSRMCDYSAAVENCADELAAALHLEDL
jgi:hypothetical protein